MSCDVADARWTLDGTPTPALSRVSRENPPCGRAFTDVSAVSRLLNSNDEIEWKLKNKNKFFVFKIKKSTSKSREIKFSQNCERDHLSFMKEPFGGHKHKRFIARE
jgi:hypothetical protein